LDNRQLEKYQNHEYDPGRRIFVRTTWYYVSLLIFESGWFPASIGKAALLRLFGANIGQGLVIHPNVRIKYPWRLSIGNNCWIGREVWIDNLDNVTLESDVCISQGAYLCTGSHDHRSPTFEFRSAPIVVRHGAWIATRAILLPGAVVERCEVISAGTVVKAKRT